MPLTNDQLNDIEARQQRALVNAYGLSDRLDIGVLIDQDVPALIDDLQALRAFATRFVNRVCEETSRGETRCTTAFPGRAAEWCDPCYAFNAVSAGLGIPKLLQP